MAASLQDQLRIMRAAALEAASSSSSSSSSSETAQGLILPNQDAFSDSEGYSSSQSSPNAHQLSQFAETRANRTGGDMIEYADKIMDVLRKNSVVYKRMNTPEGAKQMITEFIEYQEQNMRGYGMQRINTENKKVLDYRPLKTRHNAISELQSAAADKRIQFEGAAASGVGGKGTTTTAKQMGYINGPFCEPISNPSTKPYIWTTSGHNKWKSDYCWICSKHLWAGNSFEIPGNIYTKTAPAPESEHKGPCSFMALAMVGLSRSMKGGRSIVPASQHNSDECTDMNNGTLLYWKMACRSEGMAWSHKICNGKKSQALFITLRQVIHNNKIRFMYIIEKEVIEQFIRDLFEQARTSPTNQMNLLSQDGTDENMWKEEHEQIAIDNIYKRLIPLCCLLNQGTDIVPQTFIYCSNLLGVGLINNQTKKIVQHTPKPGSRLQGHRWMWREWSWLFCPEELHTKATRTVYRNIPKRGPAPESLGTNGSILKRIWQNCFRLYNIKKGRLYNNGLIYKISRLTWDKANMQTLNILINRLVNILSDTNKEGNNDEELSGYRVEGVSLELDELRDNPILASKLEVIGETSEEEEDDSDNDSDAEKGTPVKSSPSSSSAAASASMSPGDERRMRNTHGKELTRNDLEFAVQISGAPLNNDDLNKPVTPVCSPSQVSGSGESSIPRKINRREGSLSFQKKIPFSSTASESPSAAGKSKKRQRVEDSPAASSSSSSSAAAPQEDWFQAAAAVRERRIRATDESFRQARENQKKKQRKGKKGGGNKKRKNKTRRRNKKTKRRNKKRRKKTKRKRKRRKRTRRKR